MSDDLRSFLWGGKQLTSLEKERARRRRVQRTDEHRGRTPAVEVRPPVGEGHGRR